MNAKFIPFEKVECTLICLDEPYCTFTKEQREYAQKRNCMFCTRLYEDVQGVAEIVEPYFELYGDEINE